VHKKNKIKKSVYIFGYVAFFKLHSRICNKSQCSLCACDTNYYFEVLLKFLLGRLLAFIMTWAALRLSSSLHQLGHIGIQHDLLLFEQQCVLSCSNICLSSFENVQLFCGTRGIQNRI